MRTGYARGVNKLLTVTALLLAALLAASCGGQSRPASTGPESGETTTQSQRYPDVREARLKPSGKDYTLSVTISSPYDSPERYADGWRVLRPGGEVLGTHELMHDHASEQPFTRTQTGLRIPDGVERITVEGRDSENGYGGKTLTIPVEGG